MTTVGHALTGLSIGVLCMPRRWSWAGKGVLLAAFAVLANVPDIPTHDHYRIRHSVFANGAGLLVLMLPLLLRADWRRRVGGWPVLIAAAAAVMSHLLLDSFYNHGRGIGILWPMSGAPLVLPMPWFSTLPGQWELSPRVARIVAIEAAFYGPILGVCAALRWWLGQAGAAPAETK